ncbi:MAG TPA: hypothetical protein VGG99_24035 [Acetobacteraceae bacterium]|jgi:hypothetical protein
MTEPEPPHEAEPPPGTTAETHPPTAETAPPSEHGAPPEDEAPTEEEALPEDEALSDEEPLAADGASLLPWLCAVGFVLLAGAIGFVWWQPRAVSTSQSAAVQSLKLQMQGLEIRLAQLERRSPGGSVDLAPLQDRIAALEKRPAANLAPLEARVATLEKRPAPPDFAPLEARIAALEKRPAPPDLAPLEARVAGLEQKTQDEQQIGARMDALSGRMDALSGRDRGADAQFDQRLSADEARLTALERDAAQVAAQAIQGARLARIVAAEAALNAGEKLGDIPGASPAVARFATVPPPTEAALRLAFPKAEKAALAAAQPDVAGKPFLSQVLARAEGLVTVRQGDRVLLGDSAAGVLARAHDALNAGDLAGAVAAVSALSGPPAAAMAGWRADAQALLDARAGLAGMATQP